MKTLLVLAIKSLWSRRVTTILTFLLVSLSMALTVGINRLRVATQQGFTQVASGTDVIVGARGGPLQLLMATVLQVGMPTHNLTWRSFERWRRHESVAWAVPLAMGDSHRGFRVLATNTDFYTHVRFASGRPLRFRVGHVFEDAHSVVLGSEVARQLGYGVDDEVVLSHGVSEAGFVKHGEHGFRVVGLLEPTGSPIDRTLQISLSAMAELHRSEGEGDAHDPHLGEEHQTERIDDRGKNQKSGAENHHRQDSAKIQGAGGASARGEGEPHLAGGVVHTSGRGDSDGAHPEHGGLSLDITAFFVGLKNRSEVLHWQRLVNTDKAEPLQAVLPGRTLQDLWATLAIIEKTLFLMTSLVFVGSLAAILLVLISGLNERRREMAVLRALGAGPSFVFLLLLSETLLLVSAAGIGAWLFLRAFFWLGSDWILRTWGISLDLATPSQVEWVHFVALVGVALLAGVLPAAGAYRRTLADGLSMRW